MNLRSLLQFSLLCDEYMVISAPRAEVQQHTSIYEYSMPVLQIIYARDFIMSFQIFRTYSN